MGISKKEKEFNDFRFSGLNWREQSNKYLTMQRVSDDQEKIIVKVGESHIVPTRYGYALVLDNTHVVFLKNWQVAEGWYGTEVLLQKEFFNVKEWGNFEDFDEEPQNLSFETWLDAAKSQSEKDENGDFINPVRWKM